MAEYRRSDDRLPTVKSRSRSMVPLLFFGMLLVLGGAVALIQPQLLPRVSQALLGSGTGGVSKETPDATFTGLYTHFGMDPLGASVVRSDKVRTALSILQQEPCDKHAIYQASVALENNNAIRAAAQMLKGYARLCPDADGEIYHAAELYYLLGDYDAAIAQANLLARLQPDNANLFYLRARALQGAKRYQEALDDYATTLRVSPDLKRVTAEAFMRMSASYEALGRACEAMMPIQMYMALDPATRTTPALRGTVADLTKKGSCADTFARGETVIPRPAGGVIRARAAVDGIEGNFIVDTGASFVTLSPAFAEKVNVTSLRAGALALGTANGVVTTHLATANSIRLGAVSASTVPLVVLDKPIANGVDGLLGMSFLSRFDVIMTTGQVQIRARPAD